MVVVPDFSACLQLHAAYAIRVVRAIRKTTITDGRHQDHLRAHPTKAARQLVLHHSILHMQYMRGTLLAQVAPCPGFAAVLWRTASGRL